MKLISWNVNGLRAVIAKGGFIKYLEEVDADIFCLQEIKLQSGQIDLNPEGYHVYWNYAVKKVIQEQLFLQKRTAFSYIWFRN